MRYTDRVNNVNVRLDRDRQLLDAEYVLHDIHVHGQPEKLAEVHYEVYQLRVVPSSWKVMLDHEIDALKENTDMHFVVVQNHWHLRLNGSHVAE